MKLVTGIFIMVIALAVLGGNILNASTREWVWDEPYAISTKVTRIAAGEELYGIDPAGAVFALTLAATEPGVAAPAGSPSPVLDVGVGPDETVFAVMAGLITTWSAPAVYTALPQQPRIPQAAGSFKQIAVGGNGYLYVLFEKQTGEQYILKGRGMQDGLTVRFEPRTLDLKSRGNWVVCKLSLPAGYNGADIDPGSVEITRIQAVIPGGTPLDAAVSIFRAPGSPASGNHEHLYARFLRYDKDDPDNGQSLAAVLAANLPAAGSKKITYPVSITVIARVASTGEWFEGTGTLNVTVHKTK